MAIEPMAFLAGTESMGFKSEGWTLDSDPPHDADRFHRARVGFARPFRGLPLVHLGISGLDVDNRDAARLTVGATDVTSEGFTIVLSTWFNTRIWRVDVNWLAIGT
jgi:hypothetical protein